MQPFNVFPHDSTFDFMRLRLASLVAAALLMVVALGAIPLKGFNSVKYGFIAIGVFMIIYYALFGVVSVLALAANLLFLVALLSMLQATLTLPGIAAIALTPGMAIDAHVLINEPIRQELRSGPDPQKAHNAG